MSIWHPMRQKICNDMPTLNTNKQIFCFCIENIFFRPFFRGPAGASVPLAPVIKEHLVLFSLRLPLLRLYDVDMLVYSTNSLPLCG